MPSADPLAMAKALCEEAAVVAVVDLGRVEMEAGSVVLVVAVAEPVGQEVAAAAVVAVASARAARRD